MKRISKIIAVLSCVALCDIIFGKKSIDQYDVAIAQAKADAYDRWLGIVHRAYDRYLAKSEKQSIVSKYNYESMY